MMKNKTQELNKKVESIVKENESLLAHGKIEQYQFNCNKLVGIAIARKILT